MAGKSKVTALPGKLKTTVDQLLNTGRFTLDQINAHLRKLATEEGIPEAALPSRSSLGRYAANFEAVASRLRDAREVAKGVVEKFGKEPDGDVARLLQELLKSLAFQTLNEAGELGASAQEVMFLSAALKNLASTGKLDAEARSTIRRVAREEALAEMEKVLDGAEKEKTSDPAAVLKKIREEVYGIFK